MRLQNAFGPIVPHLRKWYAEVDMCHPSVAFFDKMVGAVFPHFSHQKHVKTLGENAIVQEKIYRKNEMVFCFEYCSDLLWEKIALEIEKNFCKFDYEGQYFITTVKSQHKFWNRN